MKVTCMRRSGLRACQVVMQNAKSLDPSAFSKIAMSRVATRSFEQDREIPKEVLDEVLSLTQTAPSSFNLQPYKVVIVQSKEGKEHLAKSMLTSLESYFSVCVIVVLFHH